MIFLLSAEELLKVIKKAFYTDTCNVIFNIYMVFTPCESFNFGGKRNKHGINSDMYK